MPFLPAIPLSLGLNPEATPTPGASEHVPGVTTVRYGPLSVLFQVLALPQRSQCTMIVSVKPDGKRAATSILIFLCYENIYFLEG
jgi:hypothetical protein